MEKFKDIFSGHLPNLLIAAAVLAIGYTLARVLLRIIKRVLEKTKIEHTVVTFTLSVLKVLLYLVVVLTVLSTIGVNVTSLLTAIGAAALTAGLALQDSLANVASGVVILFNKPFVAGDILEFEGVKGTVKQIGVFSTTLFTFDNKIVTIPNSRLTVNNIINCTMVDKRRIDLTYSISYDDDIDKVKQVLYALISTVDKALDEPEPSVNVGEYLDSGIEIKVWIWVKPDDYYDVYFYMQENVKKEFDKNGITIPYPHIVIKSNE